MYQGGDVRYRGMEKSMKRYKIHMVVNKVRDEESRGVWKTSKKEKKTELYRTSAYML